MAALADLPRTKIVCTVGPASRNETVIERLIQAGASVFRLNFSHGSHQEHGESLRLIRTVSGRLQRRVAVVQDLCGPKIRVGDLPPEGITVSEGQTLIVAREPGKGAEGPGLGIRGSGRSAIRNPQAAIPPRIGITYPQLIDDVRPGDQVLIDDGLIRLAVESTTADEAICRVSVGGTILPHKGVNLPGVRVSAPAATEKDLADLEWGLANDIDYVALSFVRTVADVRRVQRVLHGRRSDLRIIAKIEKPEALEHIAAIVDAADGLMVARGDLGVEMPLEQVPLIQKDLIDRCHAAHKPVIVATQMLQSMTDAPVPTRAEVSDVATAVFDGADAVMLSGETAVGRYPVNAVLIMARIAKTAETFLAERQRLQRPLAPSKAFPTADAICDGAARIAADLRAALVVVTTRSGTTALLMSKNRLAQPVLALSDDPRTVNRLALFWGVLPLHSQTVGEFDRLLAHAEGYALDQRLIAPGEAMVLVGGTQLGRTGATDMLRVHRVRAEEVARPAAGVPAAEGGGPAKRDVTTVTTAAGTHTLNQALCVQCGVCVQRCPVDVYRAVGGRVELDPAAAANCLFDNICRDCCPTRAIGLRRAKRRGS